VSSVNVFEKMVGMWYRDGSPNKLLDGIQDMVRTDPKSFDLSTIFPYVTWTLDAPIWLGVQCSQIVFFALQAFFEVIEQTGDNPQPPAVVVSTARDALKRTLSLFDVVNQDLVFNFDPQSYLISNLDAAKVCSMANDIEHPYFIIPELYGWDYLYGLKLLAYNAARYVPTDSATATYIFVPYFYVASIPTGKYNVYSDQALNKLFTNALATVAIAVVAVMAFKVVRAIGKKLFMRSAVLERQCFDNALTTDRTVANALYAESRKLSVIHGILENLAGTVKGLTSKIISGVTSSVGSLVGKTTNLLANGNNNVTSSTSETLNLYDLKRIIVGNP